MFKKILLGIVLLGFVVVGAYALKPSHPELKNGDLIFHTSMGGQAKAIFAATASPLTHMGIIKHTPTGIVVIEAGYTVVETPLQQWIDRGMMDRYSIYRHQNLNNQDITGLAKPFYGKRYDIFFSFDNDRYYCSELPYLIFKKIGIDIGKIQTVSELNTDNTLVEKLIKKRWQQYPECTKRKFNYDQCRTFIMNQTLITPISIAKDPQFTQIYSNYAPF